MAVSAPEEGRGAAAGISVRRERDKRSRGIREGWRHSLPESVSARASGRPAAPPTQTAARSRRITNTCAAAHLCLPLPHIGLRRSPRGRAPRARRRQGEDRDQQRRGGERAARERVHAIEESAPSAPGGGVGMVGPLRRVGMVGPLRRDLRPMSRTPDRRAPGTERRRNGACARRAV
jgi:hypothetical protein